MSRVLAALLQFNYCTTRLSLIRYALGVTCVRDIQKGDSCFDCMFPIYLTGVGKRTLD